MEVMQNETMWKLATPVISYIGTAVVKMLFGAMNGKIPSWLKPIIAGLLGTASTIVTGVPPVEAFALGGGAPLVNEVVGKVTGKTADLGNG